MPYTNPHYKTRYQRQQRRAGQVRRVEFILDADSERDHAINDFLDSLPRGEVGEFIRQAIAEKMRRTPTEPENPTASEQFNAILAELAALRKAVTKPPQAAEQAGARITAPQPADSNSAAGPELTPSRGIDMHRPRALPAPVRAPALPSTLSEVEPPFDPDASRRFLVESIKRFGQDRMDG